MPRATEVYVDWRATAAADDLLEYDRFGPWIDVVRSLEDMPKLFRTHYDQHRDARFLLKIPKRIDRAQARPGMQLYAGVLAVHEDRICLLAADDDRIVTTEAALSDAVAVRTTTNLLVSNWTLQLTDGRSLGFPFNSMGLERIGEVTEFVRTQHPPRFEELTVASIEVPREEDFFRSSLLTLRQNSLRPVVPLHLEPRNRVCRDQSGRRSLSNGVLIAATPSDLVLVDRGDALRPWYRRATYVSGNTFVPYSRINGFRVTTPGPRSDVHRLELRSGDQTVSQWCTVNPGRVVDYLESLGVRRS